MSAVKSKVHNIASTLSACNKNEAEVIYYGLKLLRKLASSSKDIAIALVSFNTWR